MEAFTRKVVSIISEIPKGKVMSYGQIARLAGSPRAARQIVRILHSMSDKYNLPWHRVINSKGQIGLSGDHADTQRKLLEEEGICFQEDGSISLEEFGFEPIHLLEDDYM